MGGNQRKGVCDELAKIAKPTLLITGTDDNDYASNVNSLILAGKIPGPWLIQIKDDGHAVMAQYPEEINKILQTFLSITKTNLTNVIIVAALRELAYLLSH